MKGYGRRGSGKSRASESARAGGLGRIPKGEPLGWFRCTLLLLLIERDRRARNSSSARAIIPRVEEAAGLPSGKIILGIGGAAIAFAVFLLFYLRGKHPFFRVPFWRVLIFFVYGAVVAPVAVLLTSYLLVRPDVETETLLGAFLVIGPMEELVKFAGPLLLVGLVRRWREEPFEWFVACAASGVGFATTENVLYAMVTPEAFQILAFRSLAPMHLLWSGWLGYRIGRRTSGGRGFLKATFAGFLIAAFLHGLWDALCFSGYLGILFVLFGGQILAFGWHVRKMAWLCANRSPRRPEPETDAAKAVPVPSAEFGCSACGVPLGAVPLRGAEMLSCAGCGRASVGRGDLFRFVTEYSGCAGWFTLEAWYGFYWRVPETESTLPCGGCDRPVPVRRFVRSDGPPAGFCDECALATGDRRDLFAMVDAFRSRLEEGFLKG